MKGLRDDNDVSIVLNADHTHTLESEVAATKAGGQFAFDLLPSRSMRTSRIYPPVKDAVKKVVVGRLRLFNAMKVLKCREF